MEMDKRVIVLALSGASGAIYGKEIFDRLFAADIEIHLLITGWAEKILNDELGLERSYFNREGVKHYDNSRFNVPVASGSFLTSGMVIAPCSMGCLGRIASGISTDLVTRVADVQMKEGRRLIIVPRETPLSAIHLENMLKLNRGGATILPAMPPLTSGPKTVEEMATVLAGRVFDQLGIAHDFVPRYNGG
jgi:4-hydroxy-3-polyprenylbenzoate decarboxylase